MTVENVGAILPYVDVFMVSSGIECASADEQLIQFHRGAGLPEPVQVGHAPYQPCMCVRLTSV